MKTCKLHKQNRNSLADVNGVQNLFHHQSHPSTYCYENAETLSACSMLVSRGGTDELINRRIIMKRGINNYLCTMFAKRSLCLSR